MQLFRFAGNQLRTIEIEGEPWFVLNDVVQVLGLSNSRMVKDRLTDDVSSTYPIVDNLGRTQETTVINEDGLYDVILESRKPESKAFRKWITSEVIPSIRKHGAYMTPETLETALNQPDALITILTRLKQEQDEKASLLAKIEADRPKVVYAEALQISKDSILIAELAKLLRQNGIQVGEIRLFQWMRDNGYLIKSGSEKNMPTQRSMEMNLMEIKIGQRNSISEGIKQTRTTKITGKGQIYFINKFKASESA